VIAEERKIQYFDVRAECFAAEQQNKWVTVPCMRIHLPDESVIQNV
jgi:hypothetical protein